MKTMMWTIPSLAMAAALAVHGPAAAQTALQVGTPAEGRLEPGDRRSGGKYQDTWTFRVRRGESYTVDLMTSDFDPVLRIDGPRGLRQSDDDGGEGLNSRIRFTAGADGVVRVSATSYSDSTGRYTLLVHDDASRAAAAAPRPITPGQTVAGRLHAGVARLDSGKYRESWTFEAHPGQHYSAVMTSSEFDTYVFVRGPGGLSLDNDDADGGTDSRLEFTAPASGVITITATSYAAGATGAYALALTTLSPEQAAAATHALCENAGAASAQRLDACDRRLNGAADGEARAQAHTARARARRAAGNNLAAVADFEAAARLAPALAAALAQDHASALLDEGARHFDSVPPDNGQAFAYFDRAIARNPDYFLAHGNRGLVYGRWGLHDLALTDLNRGIELAPDNPRAWEVRGAYHASRDDFSAARADYDRALRLNPDYARGYWARGLLFQRMGDQASAISDFSQTIRLEPRNEPVLRLRGWARFHRQDWAGAEADFVQATSVSRSADGFYGLGASRQNLGRVQEAITAYDTVLAIDSSHADALHNRRQLGQFVQAEAERDRLYQQCLSQQQAQRDAQERRALGDAALGLAGLLSGASAAAVREAQMLDRAIAGAAPSAPSQCVR